MKLVDMKCPNCGSDLKVDMVSKACNCEYCGAKLLIDDDTVHVKYDNAEESGYQFEKGRQRAQKEAAYSARINLDQSIPQKQPKKKTRIWLWVLGWICIFPLPLTILMLRKKNMKPAIKYGIIAVAWIVYLLIGASGSNGSDTNTAEPSVNVESTTTADNSDTEKTDIAESEKETKDIINIFVEQFNKKSETPLEYTEDFTPSDNGSAHYRTEFRLSAYKDAKGKSYTYGDVAVDLVARESWAGDVLRIYMDGASFEQCVNMLTIASPIMDPDITDDELKEAVDYITENKEANGYYFADLGLLLLGSDARGYEFMLKPGND